MVDKREQTLTGSIKKRTRHPDQKEPPWRGSWGRKPVRNFTLRGTVQKGGTNKEKVLTFSNQIRPEGRNKRKLNCEAYENSARLTTVLSKNFVTGTGSENRKVGGRKEGGLPLTSGEVSSKKWVWSLEKGDLGKEGRQKRRKNFFLNLVDKFSKIKSKEKGKKFEICQRFGRRESSGNKSLLIWKESKFWD